MAKNNIRSVRFSDELIEIIEQQVGDNFTQKFERLVYNCYMLLPEKERQLRDMEARYQKAKESYFALSDRYRDAQTFMISLENRLKGLEQCFKELETKL
mgnify:FL=1